MQNFQQYSYNKNYILLYEFYLNNNFNNRYLNSLSKWELFDLSLIGVIMQHYPIYFYLTEKESIEFCLKNNLSKDASTLNICPLISRLFIFTKSKYGHDSDFLIVFGYLFEIYWDVYLDYFEKYANKKYNPNTNYGIDNIIKLGEKMMDIAKSKLKNPSFNNYDYINLHWQNSITKDEFLYIANSIRFNKERNFLNYE